MAPTEPRWIAGNAENEGGATRHREAFFQSGCGGR
jgi:hypothetical protein